MTRWVFAFDEGSRTMRELLGGKGANVAEMTRVLGRRRVPPGFTISTAACVAYMRDGREPAGLAAQVGDALARLEQTSGKRFGDDADPLLVSVRSGARESMPGMLDTILNIGLSDSSVEGLACRTGNERFAWDSYRRLIEMFGTVVHGLPREQFALRSDEALPIAARGWWHRSRARPQEAAAVTRAARGSSWRARRGRCRRPPPRPGA